MRLDRGLKILRMEAGTLPRVVELLEPKRYKTKDEENSHFGLQKQKERNFRFWTSKPSPRPRSLSEKERGNKAEEKEE